VAPARLADEAARLCDRIGLLHQARLRAVGRPGELEAGLGPGATLDDVFRHYTGEGLLLAALLAGVAVASSLLPRLAR
jgi:ABC-2 type transport system ATP-binding protein